MSTNKSKHLELHSWEPFDAFTREEFNDNFEKIDAAVQSDREGIAKAQLTAEKAQSAADSAQSAAQNAQGTADTAQSAAQKAQGTADSAQSAANAAQSTANTALSAAQKAQNTADTEAAAIRAALGSAGKNCRIQTGTYPGKGAHGPTNQNSLSFSFTPQVVFVTESNGTNRVTFINPVNYSVVVNSRAEDYLVTVTWSGRGLTWFIGNSDEIQLNKSDTTYYYVVIGYDS